MFIPGPGYDFFLPDPGSKRFRTRTRIKVFLTQKIVSKLWGNMIRDAYLGSLDPDLDFFTHPGYRIQKSKRPGSRIRIRNTGFGEQELQPAGIVFSI
jgi:hypothetical protein